MVQIMTRTDGPSPKHYTKPKTKIKAQLASLTDAPLLGREDEEADVATIRLLGEVTALRRQLRALEPELSKAITEFGWRRGQSGYREFHLTSRLGEI
jgi:hypothetical protein